MGPPNLQQSLFCPDNLFTSSSCSPNEAAAVIAGAIALIVLVANLLLAVATLRVNLRSTAKLARAREAHELVMKQKDQEQAAINLENTTKLARAREEHELALKEKDQEQALINLENAAKLARAREEHELVLKKKDQEQVLILKARDEQAKVVDRAHAMALLERNAQEAKALEEHRRVLDIQKEYLRETIGLQINRLRDLRRACDQTLKEVKELARLSPSLERADMLVRTGEILRKASVILAPANGNFPDLPEPCYAPLGKVRDGLVKVILSWSTEKGDRQPNSRMHTEMIAAVAEMQDAVAVFVPAAQEEELRVMTSIVALPEVTKSTKATAGTVDISAQPS